jgi:hypothetical protein
MICSLCGDCQRRRREWRSVLLCVAKYRQTGRHEQKERERNGGKKISTVEKYRDIHHIVSSGGSITFSQKKE